MSNFLFVNKTAQSSSLAHSTETGEKASIYAHVQRGKKHTRHDQQPIALTTIRSKHSHFQTRPKQGRSDTSTIANVDDDSEGEAQIATTYSGLDGDVSKLSLATEAPEKYRHKGSGKTAEKGPPPNTHIKFRQWSTSRLLGPKKKTTGIATLRTSASDPFNASCIDVDPEIHSLLQYYMSAFHPTLWRAEDVAQPRRKAPYTFASGARDIVRGCLDDEMNMYAILAASAGRMKTFEGVVLQRDVAFYYVKALEATRRKIEFHSQVLGNAAIIDGRMIMNMFYLSVSEWFQMNYDAALVHVKAVKELVDRIGGIRNLDEQLRAMIALGDSYLAAETFGRPVFDARDFDPGKQAAIAKWLRSHSDRIPQLDSTNCGSAFAGWKFRDIIPDGLREDAKDLAECIHILTMTQQTTDAPAGTAKWIYLRSLSIRHRLLARKTTDPRAEATRIALIMFELMNMSLPTRKRTVKVMAPGLKRILSGIKLGEWGNERSLLGWTLTIGALSSPPGSTTETWFVEEIVMLMISSVQYCFKDLDWLVSFSKQFLYLESVQEPMMRDLATMIAKTVGAH